MSNEFASSSTRKRGGLTAAIYVCVARGEKRIAENQLHELRSYCKRMKHAIYKEYIDIESVAGIKSEPKQLATLFEDAEKRKFDVALFWGIECLAREGLQKAVSYLQRLEASGVKFHSHSENYLEALSSLANQERRRISERTKAGMAKARKEGRIIGRPDKGDIAPEIGNLAKRGMSKSAIAKELNVDVKTVRKYYPPRAA